MDGALRIFTILTIPIILSIPISVNSSESGVKNNEIDYLHDSSGAVLQDDNNKNLFPRSNISNKDGRSFQNATAGHKDMPHSHVASTSYETKLNVNENGGSVTLEKTIQLEKIKRRTEISLDNALQDSLVNSSTVSAVNADSVTSALSNIGYTHSLKGNDTHLNIVHIVPATVTNVSDARADISPHDFTEVETTSQKPSVTVSKQENSNHSTSPPSFSKKIIYPAMSWLDVFMLRHRDSFWVIVNTVFMVIWILIGLLSLYRLFGLPWCSPYISRTKYLVIHLLIFTASTFEFVQLIHLSYGSHEGLPLFLTLLLTHTPTPCLAAALIMTFYCVLVAARIPLFGSYLPPIIYVSILMSFIIVLSFVGDIIIGVTRSSLILILIRASLLVIYLFCSIIFLCNYRKVVGVALLMRREYRGDLKSLAIPVDSVKDNSDSKLHLKKIILSWTRVTLVSCLLGIVMCGFSFSLSLFFTIPYVPLWAFWVVHTSIFVSQVLVVFFITFAATITLTYNHKENIFCKYFCPSFPSADSSNGSFIKRGNFIYQRVSVANGPVVTSSSCSPTIVETEETNFHPNNSIITEISSPPSRTTVNLKRSATFNCTPPYGFHRSSGGTPFTPNLYPVLSDHILPYSQPYYSNINRTNVNYPSSNRGYAKPTIQHSHSFHHHSSNRENDHGRYNHGIPFQSFHSHDRFAALDNISKGTQQRELRPTSVNMAGTVEPLEVTYQPINIIPLRPTEENVVRQIPHNHSFNAADRQRSRPVRSPPEKPARKTGPILVKSVIKENACIENAVPLNDSRVNDDKRAYSPKDFSNSISSSCYPNNLSKNTVPNISLSPNVNAYSDISSSTPLIVSKNSFNTVTPSVSPIDSQYQAEAFPYQLKTSRINFPSTTDSGSPKFNGTSSSDKNDVSVAETKAIEEISQNNNSLISEHNMNDQADLSLSTEETNVSLETFSPIKRQPLRRNHSTAGDYSQPQKEPETDDKTSVEISHENGEFKNPWYGTWGGRRKSKKRFSSLGQEHSASNSTLRKLSSSKSSLSSIYEKLKPKKSKGTYKKAQTEEHENGLAQPSSITNEKDELSNSSISHEEEEEEEEELLPRLDEDIDLASEILKSSTVLADFYSLDRSYLKKRKKERMERYKEEDEVNGTFELNGMKNDSDSSSSSSSKVSTSTLHAEEKT